MKAVEVEVSVISDCLIDATTMVPKTEADDLVLKQCNGSLASSVRHSPVRTNSTNCAEDPSNRLCGDTVYAQVNGNVKTNGSNRTELNGKQEKNWFQNGVIKDHSPSHNVNCIGSFQCGAEQRLASLNFSTNESNHTSCLQNGSDKESTPRKSRNSVEVLPTTTTNGVANDGDDEKLSLESLIDAPTEEAVSKRSSSPPEDIPRLQADSGLESAASSWDHSEARLRDELQNAREQLKLKDDEVLRLTRVRAEVESELEELTASLFQEAHAMVRVANERQAAAEKALRESSMQVDVLTAEVAALKTLVLTSTPSRPNLHLHPQIDPKSKEETNSSGNTLFRKHRRSPSHFNLKYGRENSPPESPTRDPRPLPPAEPIDQRDPGVEVDPVLYKEFLAWKESPTMEQSNPFIARVYQEDINCCLTFSNCQLAAEVQAAVESETIYIEAVNEKTKTLFPKKCALLETPRMCQYRMRLGDADTWHSISHVCRNRIIAVCDFLNYLKYIQRGLVKSSVNDVYWETMRLRKEMVLARLGLPLSS